MPFIFYDTETTGLHKSFDQILQFAAIKTDDELNIVDTFDIRCRLLSHIVPSPKALLVTGVTVDHITNCPLSHFEMMRQVHAKMRAWSDGGVIFIGWNSMQFDENMLRQAYYQSLLPIYQTNTNGNGRADAMRMAQVAAACLPNSVAIPMQENGKSSFKLGLVAEANGIVLENAHEALADTQATLAVARVIRQRCPAIWDALLRNARKGEAQRLIEQNQLLLLSENYFGSAYSFIVSPIAPNADNPSEWGVFDLQFDPAPLLKASEADLKDAIEGKIKPIRRVAINAQPAILPLDHAPEDIRGGRQPMAIYQARASIMLANGEFRERVSRALASRYEDQEPAIHPEERIYDGFPSREDTMHMNSFHQYGPAERPGILAKLKDERLRQFGYRIIASEHPELLTPKQRQQWQSWRHERLVTEDDVPWLTVPRALDEATSLMGDASPVHRRQLAKLQQFLSGLAS